MFLCSEQSSRIQPPANVGSLPPKTLDASLLSVCKPLGLIDDLSRFFLPTNQRRSRVSSKATMTAADSVKLVNNDSTVPTATKLLQQKSKQPRNKKPLLNSQGPKHSSAAVHIAKRLKQKSVNKGSKMLKGVSHVKSLADVCKPKQHRQHRDHVESLIDGLTDYFTAHGERRLKSPALKSIGSYGSDSQQAVSSYQLDTATETGVYSAKFSHRQPQKQKKATVEKLFDGLSSFFAVQSEHRRYPTSPVTPGGQEAGLKNAAVDRRTASSETKLSRLLNIPSINADRKMMAANSSQLKGLFDGLSHLYTAHGDRKRKSPFYYTAQPTKSSSVASQLPSLSVKQEAVGNDVSESAVTNQTAKPTNSRQAEVPSKLNTNKSQSSKKSPKPVSPVTKKPLPSSGI